MSISPSDLRSLDQNLPLVATPPDGVDLMASLVEADSNVSFDAAASRYRLPDQLDDSDESYYVSPMADAESDSERSLILSPVGFAGSVASHNTMQTEATTPESAAMPLPKPDLYPTTQSSPKRQGATFSLPPSQNDSSLFSGEPKPALYPDSKSALGFTCPPTHSTPVLGSGDESWSSSPSSGLTNASVNLNEEEEEAKFRRLEQSLSLLVFNDEEDSADLSKPQTEEQRPVLRSFGSEKVVIVFNSPALSEPQSARLDKFETPLMDSPDIGRGESREVESSVKRAVLMAPQEANNLLGFQPESDVVVAMVEDAHQAALDALRRPDSEDLDFASAPPLEPAPSSAMQASGADADLSDFSFLCGVMDTSGTQDDSFFSTVSEPDDTSTLNNLSLSFARSAVDRSITADRSASSILARPRPQTYKSARHYSPFANTDAPVVVPKRNNTVKVLSQPSAADKPALVEKSRTAQKPKSVDKRVVAEKRKPVEKTAVQDVQFNLPIRPRSIRRTSVRRKWTVSYIDSTGRGVPHDPLRGGSILDRSRFDAQAPKKPKKPIELLPPPQTPVGSREKYPTLNTLFPNAQPLSSKPVPSTKKEESKDVRHSNSSASKPKRKPDLDLLINVKPSKDKNKASKETATNAAAREANAKGTATDEAATQAEGRLKLLREAIALAQEEVARLEAAEKAAQPGRKRGSLLSSLRSKQAGSKPDKSGKGSNSFNHQSKSQSCRSGSVYPPTA